MMLTKKLSEAKLVAITSTRATRNNFHKQLGFAQLLLSVTSLSYFSQLLFSVF